MGMLCVYIFHLLPHFKIFFLLSPFSLSFPTSISSFFVPTPFPPSCPLLPTQPLSSSLPILSLLILTFSPCTPQVLSSKRYDLEGFAEYARQLRECQAFQEREGASIGYVLRVHTALGKHGVEVPAQDKVHHFDESLSLLFLPPFLSSLHSPLPLSSLCPPTSSLSLFLPLLPPPYCNV